MKYKQMSLREAFHYLRSRRHIIGPNFGFIKQVCIYLILYSRRSSSTLFSLSPSLFS